MIKEGDRVIEAAKVAPVDSRKPEKRYETAKDGSKIYHGRADPSHATNRVTFPENEALGYLEDHEKWSIVEETTMLGHTALVVAGELPASYQSKHLAETFKFWVDKEIGMLLKALEYNASGDAVEHLEVTALEVNGAVEEDLFRISQEEIDKL